MVNFSLKTLKNIFNQLGITPKELEMAEKLVSGMVESWQPEKYRDDYRKDLMSLIHARAKAGDVNNVSTESTKAPRPPKSAKVVDLVALLAQSVKSGPERKSKTHAHGSARASHAAASHATRAQASASHAKAKTKRRTASKPHSDHAVVHHRKSA